MLYLLKAIVNKSRAAILIYEPLPACAPAGEGIKIARTLFVSDMSPFTVCPVKGGHIISAWLCKGPYFQDIVKLESINLFLLVSLLLLMAEFLHQIETQKNLGQSCLALPPLFLLPQE